MEERLLHEGIRSNRKRQEIKNKIEIERKFNQIPKINNSLDRRGG